MRFLATLTGQREDLKMEERRTKRSSDPGEALTLLLESQRRSLGVKGLTVATQDGEVLAASYAGGSKRGRRRKAEDPVATWALQVGTRQLVISSYGGRLSHEIGTGVRRIGNGQP